MKPVVTRYTFRITEQLARTTPCPDCRDSNRTTFISHSVDVELRDWKKAKGKGWAIVVDYKDVLNKDFDVEYEPLPSSRSDDFINRTRYTLEDALKRAKKFIAMHKKFDWSATHNRSYP